MISSRFRGFLRKALILVGSLAAVALIAHAAQVDGGIPAQPIPHSSSFPTSKATIDGWVAANDVTAIRNHAWDLWAGMTAPTVAGLPIWETWYSPDEVFQGASLPTAAQRTRPSRPFISPNQFHHQAKLAAPNAAPASSTAEQLVAFNKFNGLSAEFIRSPHKRSSDSLYHYYIYTNKQSLENLDAGWPEATQPIDRTILDFPNTAVDSAIDTKPVFLLIKAKGLTAFPYWQGPAQSTDQRHPSPGTWKNCVLVDPTAQSRKAVRVKPVDLTKINDSVGLGCTNHVKKVPLSMFYSFVLNAAEAKAFNKVQGGGAVAGDYAVLAAMHVTSKEIKNWTWQTYWWQGDEDPPNDFPGSRKGMSSKVKGPWRNYAMCTAYSMTVKNQPQGAPVVCFNPYLETSSGIPDGINSNCMTCHGRATIDSNGNSLNYPATYLPNGWTNFNDPTLFGKTTRTDFVWAIPDTPN